MTIRKKPGRNRAVFIDRDGVLNRKPPEHDYVKSWEEFEWLSGAIEAVKLINDQGWLAIVVTNQRGVARGLMTPDAVNEIHTKMKQDLKTHGARLDAIYWCGHDYSDKCRCRKPAPGMILKAAKNFDIDLVNSWIIGDSISDIEMAQKVGCQAKKIKPNGSLLTAVKEIVNNKRK